MNILDEIRKRKLLGIPLSTIFPGGQQTTGPYTNNTAPMTMSPLNPPEAIQPQGLLGLRARQTPHNDALVSYLGNEPKESDYKPGKISKILASIAGFSEGMNKGPGAAYNLTSGLFRQPYERALESHKSRGGRLRELADIEYRTLTDDQKLEIQIAEDQLKKREEARNWLKTQSDVAHSEAQVENIMSQIQNRGLSIQKNERTGELEVVNITNGSRRSLGKFAETPSERRADEHRFFRAEEGIRQAGRITLEGIRNANETELSKLRSRLTQGNELLRQSLDSLSATQQKAAFELAYQQASIDNPELEADDPGQFMNVMRSALDNIRKRATGTNLPYQPITPNVSLPGSSQPQINNSDNEAREALREIGITNPTPAQIQEAKKDLGLN